MTIATNYAFKDLRVFFKKKINIVLFFILPAIITGIIGGTFSGFEFNNIPLGACDNLKNSFSTSIMQRIGEGGTFHIYESCTSQNEMVMNGDYILAITIQKNNNIDIYTDNSKTFLSQFAVGEIEKRILNSSQTDVNVINAFPAFKPIDFLSSDIILITIMLLSLLFSAFALLSERGSYSLTRLFTSRSSSVSFLFGKMLGMLAITLGEVVVLFTIMLISGISIPGSAISVFIIAMVFSMTFICLGFILSTISDSEKTAVLLVVSVAIPLIFISSSFMPSGNLEFAKFINENLPNHFALDALNRIAFRGAPITGVTGDINALLIYAIGSFVVAYIIFMIRREEYIL